MIKSYTNNKTVFSAGNNSFASKTNTLPLTDVIKQYKGIATVEGRDPGRADIVEAISNYDINKIREVSNRYYRNPIYSRLIEYMATLPTYCWAVVPRLRASSTGKEKILNEWYQILDYLEEVNPEIIGARLAREVLLNGACYISVKKDTYGIQVLPIRYCRSVKIYKNQRLVDFNVKYFDSLGEKYKRQALESYPEDIVAKYYAYKALPVHDSESEWQTLDPGYSYKFTLNNQDLPLFALVIPEIMDLTDTKDMDMYKLEQTLTKIFVQKFGVNNNGDPIFPLPDVQRFHQDVADMLSDTPGLSVVSTYADPEVLPIQDIKTNSTSPVEESLKNVYDAAGVSGILFDSTAAGSLGRSINVNENLMFDYVKQINEFLNILVKTKFERLVVPFKVVMPFITTFNMKDMYTLYAKETTTSSQLLAQVILGRREGDVISEMYFESSKFLKIAAEQEKATSTNVTTTSQESPQSTSSSSGEVGRPELSDDEKSEKTIANKETIDE